MATKKKGRGKQAAFTIEYGNARRKRIANYCAKKQLEGTPISGVEAMTLIAVDKELDAARV